MTESPALAFARRDLARKRAALATDAKYFADAAERFWKYLSTDAPSGGEASRLAQEALQLALAETRLVALAETVQYLEAAESAPDTKEND